MGKEATFRLEVNRKVLKGRKVGERWVFRCPEYPQLAQRYLGDEYITGITYDFTKWALTGKKWRNW